MKKLIFPAAFLILISGCGNSEDVRQRAGEFIDNYTNEYQQLYYRSARAEWQSNTHIVEGDSSNAVETRRANEALAGFTGSADNIKKIRGFLENSNDLSDLQVRQLETMLYMAGNNPGTVPDVVKARIKAEAAQTEHLYGFSFTVDGTEITPNEIDDILRTSTDLKKRLQAWRASKAVGTVLK
ncbi:MAG: M2 family metallopeptidase, partial [Calditrichia bacterium]